jgi:hypothetical protein
LTVMVLPGRRFNELAIVPGLGLLKGTTVERCFTKANRAFLAGAVGCDPSRVPGCESLWAARAPIGESASVSTSPADNIFKLIDAIVGQV